VRRAGQILRRAPRPSPHDPPVITTTFPEGHWERRRPRDAISPAPVQASPIPKVCNIAKHRSVPAFHPEYPPESVGWHITGKCGLQHKPVSDRQGSDRGPILTPPLQSANFIEDNSAPITPQ
jgi:hypothetical protein